MFGSAVSQRPEPRVAADHRRAAGAKRSALARVFDRALHQHCRHGLAEMLLELGVAGQIGGQLGAKETVGHQHVVDRAQLIEQQVPQAAAHRIADQQGAGQHGAGRHDGQRHGQIGSPVIAEPGDDQANKRHTDARLEARFCRPAVAARAGACRPVPSCGSRRPASSALALAARAAAARRRRPWPDRDCRSARRPAAGRAVDQRPGDGRALALAAGELGRQMLEPIGQSDAVEQMRGRARRFRAAGGRRPAWGSTRFPAPSTAAADGDPER